MHPSGVRQFRGYPLSTAPTPTPSPVQSPILVMACPSHTDALLQHTPSRKPWALLCALVAVSGAAAAALLLLSAPQAQTPTGLYSAVRTAPAAVAAPPAPAPSRARAMAVPRPLSPEEAAFDEGPGGEGQGPLPTASEARPWGPAVGLAALAGAVAGVVAWARGRPSPAPAKWMMMATGGSAATFRPLGARVLVDPVLKQVWGCAAGGGPPKRVGSPAQMFRVPLHIRRGGGGGGGACGVILPPLPP